MYFYESHLGGNIYTTDYEKTYDELYCEECGDSDTFLGEYDTWEEFIKDLGTEYASYDPEFLAETAGITVDRLFELNPKLKEDYDEYYNKEENNERPT